METSTNRMCRQTLAITGMLFLLTAIAMPTGAESQNNSGESHSEKTMVEPDSELSLVRVEPKYVCMPNNRVFKKEQLSTDIDGKTYYGCCQMCINALNKDPQQRYAIDPVSGNEIDKATAVIGAAPDNTIYYFETEENLESFKLETAAEE